MGHGHITVDELATALEADEPRATVVDVRGSERQGGWIPGSWDFPHPAQVDAVLDRILEDRRVDSCGLEHTTIVVFHCMFSQLRGPSAAKRFHDLLERRKLTGLVQSVVLTGGFCGWLNRFVEAEPNRIEGFDASCWVMDATAGQLRHCSEGVFNRHIADAAELQSTLAALERSEGSRDEDGITAAAVPSTKVPPTPMPFPTSYTIETQHLRLRIPAESDFPYVFSATRYPGFNDGMVWEPPKSMDELVAPLKRAHAAWEEGRAYQFTIERKDNGDFLGRLSIRILSEVDIWNVGFWTHPTQQGKGVMTEALQGLLKFGFEELQASRIEACHALWNKASEQVLKKNGMKFVRYIEQGFLKHGKWVEENLLAIERRDWEGKP